MNPAGGADYTSIQAWNDAEKGNIASGDRHILQITASSQSPETSHALISGWTGPGDLILMRSPDTHEAIIRPLAGVPGNVIEIERDSGVVYLKDLYFDGASMNQAGQKFIDASKAINTRVVNCTFRDLLTHDSDAIFFDNTDEITGHLYAENCEFFNIAGAGLIINNELGLTSRTTCVTAYNMCHNAQSGKPAFGYATGSFQQGTGSMSANNAAIHCASSSHKCISQGSSGRVNGNNCATSDDTGPGSGSMHDCAFQDTTNDPGQGFVVMLRDLTGGVLQPIDHPDNDLLGNGFGTFSFVIPDTDYNGTPRGRFSSDIGIAEANYSISASDSFGMQEGSINNLLAREEFSVNESVSSSAYISFQEEFRVVDEFYRDMQIRISELQMKMSARSVKDVEMKGRNIQFKLFKPK